VCSKFVLNVNGATVQDTQDRLAASEAEEGPSQDLSSPSRGAEGDDVGEREKNLKLLVRAG
jgi:hypothetical protein